MSEACAYDDQQLHFTGAFYVETMLAVYEDVVEVGVQYGLRNDDMLCDFTADSQQRDRLVVFSS